MEVVDITDKTAMLIYRTAMICYDAKQSCNNIGNTNQYKEVLNSIANILDQDTYFFCLQDYLSKTQYLLRLCSLKFNTTGEVRNFENNLIISLNMLSTIPDKAERIEEFLFIENAVRGGIIDKTEGIYTSMANDLFILRNLEEAIGHKKELTELDSEQFIQSTNFFIEIMPELYECDGVIEITDNYLSQIENDDANCKKYVKDARRKLYQLYKV